MSFFVALTILCDQIMDAHFDTISSRILFGAALSQWIYGMFICLYLYGRKVSINVDDDDDDDDDDTEYFYGGNGR